MAEIPLIIVDVQRGGPSTGMPTNVEQTDLNLAVFGSHGDSPRVVLAPANVEDCFYIAIEARKSPANTACRFLFSATAPWPRASRLSTNLISKIMQDPTPDLTPRPDTSLTRGWHHQARPAGNANERWQIPCRHRPGAR